MGVGVDARGACSRVVAQPLVRVFHLHAKRKALSSCTDNRGWNKSLPIEQPLFIKAGGNFSIEKGAWIALATLDRCGTKVTRRVLLKAVSGKNSLAPTFLLPGEFRGNLQLEVDAVKIVTPALAAAAKCQDLKQLKIVDIKSLTPPVKDGWSETWTADACGKIVDCAVSYGATGDGMDITAGKCAAH